VAAEDIAVEQPILFLVPLDGVLHVVVFARRIAFDDMQCFRMGRTEKIDHRMADRLPMVAPANGSTGLTLTIAPSASTFDGSFSNNAWLQECRSR
jgi:hypothetical protein